jgi:hypothetical protein
MASSDPSQFKRNPEFVEGASVKGLVVPAVKLVRQNCQWLSPQVHLERADSLIFAPNEFKQRIGLELVRRQAETAVQSPSTLLPRQKLPTVFGLAALGRGKPYVNYAKMVFNTGERDARRSGTTSTGRG